MNGNLQTTRLLMLLGAGSILAGSIYGWSVYTKWKMDNFAPPPPVVPVGPAPHPVPTARPIPIKPIIGSAKPVESGSGAPRKALGVNLNSISVDPHPSNLLPRSSQPILTEVKTPTVQPTVTSGIAAKGTKVVASATAASSTSTVTNSAALEAWKKRKDGELYRFLFTNGPSPVVESTPTGPGVSGVIKATTYLEAVTQAKLSAGLSSDPCQSIELKDYKPFPCERKEKSVDWYTVMAEKPKVPNIPQAPNPSFPIPPPPPSGGLVPPPPPTEESANGGLPIDQLPLPPDKPAADISGLKIVCIFEDSVMFTLPGHGHTLIVKSGDEFEGIKVVRVTPSSVLFDDGNRLREKRID